MDRETYIPLSLEASFHSGSQKGYREGRSCCGTCSFPPEAHPGRTPVGERWVVWGLLGAGLAWVCPAVRLGLVFQSHGPLGGYAPGMHVCAPKGTCIPVWLYVCGCL